MTAYPAACFTRMDFSGAKRSVSLSPVFLNQATPGADDWKRRCNPSVANAIAAVSSARLRRYRASTAGLPASSGPRRSIASTSDRASPRPRFRPCPASGCTLCAASPTRARRGPTTLAARINRNGNAAAAPTLVNAQQEYLAARRSGNSTLLTASRDRLIGMVLLSRPYHRNMGARQRQQRQHAFRAKPLPGRAAMGFGRTEVSDHCAVAVGRLPDFDPGQLAHAGIRTVGSND